MAPQPASLAAQAESEAPVRYIFDTDLFTIASLRDSPEYLRVHARFLELAEDDLIATTIITYEEQTRGWLAYAARSQQTAHQIKAYARLKKHLTTYMEIEVLDFDEAAAREYERLRSLKIRTGAADLKIASIAISQDAVLLSRNLKDFQRVPDLRVEDWTKPR